MSKKSTQKLIAESMKPLLDDEVIMDKLDNMIEMLEFYGSADARAIIEAQITLDSDDLISALKLPRNQAMAYFTALAQGKGKGAAPSKADPEERKLQQQHQRLGQEDQAEQQQKQVEQPANGKYWMGQNGDWPSDAEFKPGAQASYIDGNGQAAKGQVLAVRRSKSSTGYSYWTGGPAWVNAKKNRMSVSLLKKPEQKMQATNPQQAIQ